jgi:tRNA(Leu) C34 or U34 (ribose-2'-O)-methylase TrmL
MRGYFAVGVDGISKPMNLGNLVRIAHAFDASFFFSIAPRLKLSDAASDTSRAEGVLPFYHFDRSSDFRLPIGCRLVGVEITDDAVELPRFRHPTRAAYVFGAERFSLSPEVLKACEFVVKIPTRFSINVGMAGAIVLYDRMLTMGGFGDRPVKAGGKGAAPPPHILGARRSPNRVTKREIYHREPGIPPGDLPHPVAFSPCAAKPQAGGDGRRQGEAREAARGGLQKKNRDVTSRP